MAAVDSELNGVGWSRWLACKAHNLEVTGSSPVPTTILIL